MKNILMVVTLIVLFVAGACSSSKKAGSAKAKVIGDSIPVRGFCIAAPQSRGVDSFVTFINQELAPRHVNVLILRIDYNYQYSSHPELRDSGALSREDVKKMVAACKAHQIKLIPQVNLLGHQSWASKVNKLLEVYPQLDETPTIAIPAKYAWPNADTLYCKSYCPLHPDVHPIVFSLIDEIFDVFESDAFHAGMDEVFYIGHSKCVRCAGKNKAELYAGEVKAIHDHLAEKKRTLWIWGDRFIDGYSSGIGMWEASQNNTWPAVDMIPKDVVICDWHYERPDKTPVYFAMKGLDVITCVWRNGAIAVQQLNDMVSFRNESTKAMKPHFKGVMQTVWMGNNQFLRGFYENKIDSVRGDKQDWFCFREMFAAMK